MAEQIQEFFKGRLLSGGSQNVVDNNSTTRSLVKEMRVCNAGEGSATFSVSADGTNIYKDIQLDAGNTAVFDNENIVVTEDNNLTVEAGGEVFGTVAEYDITISNQVSPTKQNVLVTDDGRIAFTADRANNVGDFIAGFQAPNNLDTVRNQNVGGGEVYDAAFVKGTADDAVGFLMSVGYRDGQEYEVYVLNTEFNGLRADREQQTFSTRPGNVYVVPLNTSSGSQALILAGELNANGDTVSLISATASDNGSSTTLSRNNRWSGEVTGLDTLYGGDTTSNDNNIFFAYTKSTDGLYLRARGTSSSITDTLAETQVVSSAITAKAYRNDVNFLPNGNILLTYRISGSLYFKVVDQLGAEVIAQTEITNSLTTSYQGDLGVSSSGKIRFTYMDSAGQYRISQFNQDGTADFENVALEGLTSTTAQGLGIAFTETGSAVASYFVNFSSQSGQSSLNMSSRTAIQLLDIKVDGVEVTTP